MDVSTIALLVGAGIVVGVINTFAGAAAVITISLFSFMGLPIMAANATNRVAVVFQTVTMSAVFLHQRMLDWKLGLRLAIPTVVGAVLGSEIITRVDTTIFVWMLAVVLLLLLAMLIFNPSRALHADSNSVKPRVIHYVLLFGVGLYGGAFHIGVGYLFLAILIMGMGYNLMQANALKGFIVLCYTIFSLTVFAINGDVNWHYGLVHGTGNLIGAYFATRYARYLPIPILRWGLIVFIGLTIIYLLLFKL